MFEKFKNENPEKNAESMAKKMLVRMLSESILESNAPEYMKLRVMILNKCRDISDILVEKFGNRYCKPDHIADTDTLKKVYEYLELVEVGLNQFLESTPLVMANEEDKKEKSNNKI